MDTDFLDELKSFLGKKVHITIDRPMHSLHPEYGFVYEVNYGFVPDTLAPDKEEIDAYLLGVHEQVEFFDGICVAIMHRKDDQDDKLIVVPESYMGITDQEIVDSVFFQEKWFDSVLIR
ncbi:MAG: hypothetical protein UV82_C0006G0059 [Candidatus Magasanikbacteria bacterium GW2011_GWD2_43_18]|uniref:inorganic diphosphatase n=1 Tax=Candidatus Magasanikbacteria bacterium GW2011_GWE2_42_7 TaxID=1619052 RepID=A0A0G1DMK0_9BACT|nr:MAG: hypothetical protein UV18_C0005G0027 [Candidatus Magasanikbacteria bacterium GW2011_GWC2_42_27]KKS72066.1 MAG: hypothetical protein UV42_C0014G0005 [Candidatus Magasanikbacteria bacterium GW2011_GWE2_42_7]KKT04703.1 MAG: hypothetical protein UV82_C0006G0059 [Candidatus Magasanikbacteria bacterium GW2011_GWD2_43_18]KKT24989.1 MAG: hypothetical protein UW10_C0016G0022 [Candidatus Magasanikbacteria bacterium GW2011_GWA2_43_9]HBB38010.1 inorganic pyrophosphatase [Candidatus Magasanikbacteri